MKKTKIVATIGFASTKVSVLEKMIRAGMNIARMNFSHGDHAEHAEKLRNVRTASKKLKAKVAILQDLSGPKIRTGDFVDGEITLKKGSSVTILTAKVLGTEKTFSIRYDNLCTEVKKGHRILLNDGKQELHVTSVGKDRLTAKVIHGGAMASRRGVNLPDSDLSLSSLTAKDRKDVAFGIKNDVEFIALSFVRSPEDIMELRRILKRKKCTAQIVAKIETIPAVEQIDAIIDVADAIMVARGDLAVEIGAAKVPRIQKQIIHKCNNAGVPVIVATQMLESMISAPVPTRAEVSDVSNAITDGADAVMLSAETAIGEYPVETVSMMSTVAEEAEATFSYEHFVTRAVAYGGEKIDTADAISRYAAKTAYDLDAKVIVALSESGLTARMLSRFKTRQPILTISPNRDTLLKTNISFGVYPGAVNDLRSIDDVMAFSRKLVTQKKLAKKGDRIVIVAGMPFGAAGRTNTILVEVV